MSELEAAIHDHAYGLGMRAGLNFAEGNHAEEARALADRMIVEARRVFVRLRVTPDRPDAS